MCRAVLMIEDDPPTSPEVHYLGRAVTAARL